MKNKEKPYGPPMAPYRAWIVVIILNAIALAILIGAILIWVVN